MSYFRPLMADTVAPSWGQKTNFTVYRVDFCGLFVYIHRLLCIFDLKALLKHEAAADLKMGGQFIFTPWPDSNPGRPGELVQNQVAVSKYTNWPPKPSTIMAIAQCTLNLQPCMIPFCDRTKILINIIYHTCLYVEHTWSHNHICAQFVKLWVANWITKFQAILLQTLLWNKWFFLKFSNFQCKSYLY